MLAFCLAWLGAAALAPAQAEEAWPQAPIRLVVPFPPGGSSDILGRIVADQLGRELHASFIVVDKPGATTQIGTQMVAEAAPDGNTLLLAASGSFSILPNMRRLPFTLDNFEVAGGVADYIAVMAVRNNLPVANLKEFVAYAKAHPGQLTYGSAGEGSVGHVLGGAFAHDTGIKVLHVPFHGSMDAVNALVGGQTDFIIDGAVSAMAKAGKVRPIATFFRSRHADLPDVPTVKEAGFDVPLIQGAGWAVAAPRGTPAPIMARLSEALRKILADPQTQEQFRRANSVSSWQTPEAYRAGVEADRKRFAELLPAIGVKKE